MTDYMKAWIRFAGIRALRTCAQTAVATIGTAVAMEGVDWKFVLSASILAGILSLLTSVAGLPEVDYETEDIEELYDTDEPEDDEEDEDIEEGL